MIEHDPNAKLDYGWDWAKPDNAGETWLDADEAIVSATVAAVTGLTIGTPTIVTSPGGHLAGYVRIWVNGGNAGTTYTLVCHIVTDKLREDDRIMELLCRNR